MTLFCYPKCSTCKKAQAYLSARGISYSYRNVKDDPPSLAELSDFVQRSHLTLQRFFNTSGQQYRNLGLSKIIQGMDTPQLLALLAGDGMLIKRPLLVDEHFVLVGFKQEQWDEVLLK
jgi:arsenate reductase